MKIRGLHTKYGSRKEKILLAAFIDEVKEVEGTRIIQSKP